MRRIEVSRLALVVGLLSVFSIVIGTPPAPAAPAAAPTSSILTIPGVPLGAMVTDDDDHAYIVNGAMNRIEVVKLSTRALEAPIPVGSRPRGLDLSPDGSLLYVANYDSHDISVVDLDQRIEVRRIDLQSGTAEVRPSSIAIADTGVALVSVSGEGSWAPLRQVDLATGASSDRIITLPALLKASGDRSRILLVMPTIGFVSLYDAATDGFTEPSSFGQSTMYGALDATGDTILIGPNTQVVRADLSVRALIPLGGMGLAVDAGGSRGYRVADNAVDVLDLTRDRVAATIPLPEQPSSRAQIALSADGTTLVLGTGSGVTVVPVGAAVAVPECTPISTVPQVVKACGQLADVVLDGAGRAYASNPDLNQVEVVSLATGALEAPIRVGSRPQGLDLTPDGKTLYVANSGATELSVVDIALRRVVRTIPVPPNTTGDRPFSIAVASNGTALLTMIFPGSGAGRLLQVDLASGLLQVRHEVRADNGGRLEASADRSRVVVADWEGAYVYHPSSNTFTPSTIDSASVDYGAPANGDGRVLSGPATYVFDSDLVVEGTVQGTGKAVAITASGTTGYRVQDSSVDVLDLAGRLKVGSISLPEPVGSAPGTVAITPDGAKLVVLTASGLSIVDTASAAITPKSAFAVWRQPTSAALDAVGTWVVPTNVPAAGNGQLPPSYLYAHYFNFNQAPTALGVIGLVTSAGTKLAALGIVDNVGTSHSVGLPFDWVANHAYYLFVAQLNPTAFGGWVYDDTAGTWTFIGQIDLPFGLGKINPATVTQVIWFGPTAATCSAFPLVDAYFHPPVGYAGGGIALATVAEAGAGAAGTCPATATTELTPWIHLNLGASLA